MQWVNKSAASVKQVQSLVGKLSFCAVAVRAGRVFFARILNFLRNMEHSAMTELTQEFKADLGWWMRVMPLCNGKSMIPPNEWVAPNTLFSTDASLEGLRGWSDGQYFCEKFPPHIRYDPEISINELEMLTLVIALKIWAHKISGKNALVQCDNQVNSRISKQGQE